MPLYVFWSLFAVGFRSNHQNKFADLRDVPCLSLGYCLEMICANFLAGANLEILGHFPCPVQPGWVGSAEGLELAKLARRDRQHCAGSCRRGDSRQRVSYCWSHSKIHCFRHSRDRSLPSINAAVGRPIL